MLLNNNIVFDIIDTNFMDEVTASCEEAVLRMDEDELGDYFDQNVESACLGIIYDMNVDNYEDEEFDGTQTVEGVLGIDALVNGYVNRGEESDYIGDADVSLGFSFSFQIDMKTNNAELFDIVREY